MRGLFLQRQIDVMVRLGDRTDAFDDRLPVLAFVLAVKDIAVGGAGEDRVAAVPDVHRHAFDVGADVFRQSAAEHIPGLAAVAAARDARIGRVELAPSARAGLRAGDEKQIWIAGMDEERVDVTDAEIARRHALPARAAVAANAKTRRRFRTAIGRRRRAVELARIVGRNEHAMRVGIDIVDESSRSCRRRCS